jgi:DNA invertase Pin-like site-specific DNA recombinase
MATYGYARVSTRDQDYTRQVEALQAAHAETIFREKISGAHADRPELALMRALKPGDTVTVTKLDRLDRSTRELLELIGKGGAFFKSLGDPLFDTSTPTGRLLSTLWRRSPSLVVTQLIFAGKKRNTFIRLYLLRNLSSLQYAGRGQWQQ